MNHVEKVLLHKKICEEMNKTYDCKNSDYGNSFGETFEEFGIISAVTRMSDKYNRIKNMAKGTEPYVKEKIEDTLLDLANYCIMTLIEIKNQKNEDIIKNNDKKEDSHYHKEYKDDDIGNLIKECVL